MTCAGVGVWRGEVSEGAIIQLFMLASRSHPPPRARQVSVHVRMESDRQDATPIDFVTLGMFIIGRYLMQPAFFASDPSPAHPSIPSAWYFLLLQSNTAPQMTSTLPFQPQTKPPRPTSSAARAPTQPSAPACSPLPQPPPPSAGSSTPAPTSPPPSAPPSPPGPPPPSSAPATPPPPAAGTATAQTITAPSNT